MVGRDNEVSFMWFLAGLGLGALAGVLYAPRSGSETREAITQTVEEGREYVKDLGHDALESVTNLVERGKNAIGQQREQVEAVIEAGRQAYREATSEDKDSLAVDSLRA